MDGTTAVGAADDTTDKAGTYDGARSGDDEVADVSTVSDDTKEADIFVAFGNHVVDVVILTIERALEGARDGTDGTPFDTAELDIVLKDSAGCTVELYDTRIGEQLLAIEDMIETVLSDGEVTFLSNATVDTDTILVLMLVLREVTLLVGEVEVVLRRTVAVQRTSRINNAVRSEGHREVINTQRLEPSGIVRRLAIEVISQSTAFGIFLIEAADVVLLTHNVEAVAEGRVAAEACEGL